MSEVKLLDCTLRDGGYVNDWNFGFDVIKGFNQKISKTGIDFYEVGFIKNCDYNKDKSIYSSINLIEKIITPKDKKMKYVAMIDMNDPIDIKNIPYNNGKSIDGIRLIFKKSKINEAFDYCKKLKKLNYMIFVQFVNTDFYNVDELSRAIAMFNEINPYAMSIVDTFGVMKKKEFLKYVNIFDKYLANDIALGYHAHNNLQQALQNSESLVELNLGRTIVVDACVFGMGRGAGNLNLELFAQYLNENNNSNYRVEPMLEIMDEYLNDIYKEKFWGYSLPLYLSAINRCHPNYAIYLSEKNSLTEKSFNELLKSISSDDKQIFTKEKANQYYLSYQQNYVNDYETIMELNDNLKNRNILLLAPGKSIVDNQDIINKTIIEHDCIVLSINFKGLFISPDYIFCSNMKRYYKIENNTNSKCIITSNMKEAKIFDYMVNFSSYICKNELISDNSGVMALKLLSTLDVNKVYIAGMDGYCDNYISSYALKELEYDFSSVAKKRNKLISEEIKEIGKKINIEFITKSKYEIG